MSVKEIVIAIPAGSVFVEAAQIPNWIAEALEPIPDAAPVLRDLQKRSLIGPEHWCVGPLTPDDWKLLDEIWRDLPDVAHVDMERFRDYRSVFAAAPNKPAWDLQASFQHLKEEARVRQMNVRSRHFWDLRAAAQAGEISLLTAQRTPTRTIEPGSLVSVDEANRYLIPRGFKLREATGTGELPCDGAKKTSRLRLSNEQRAEIVRRAQSGEKHKALADEFGVTRQYIGKLCSDTPQNAIASWYPSARKTKR